MADLQYCAVCGQGSHRDDWENEKTVGGKNFVACDFHTPAEFNAAINKVVGLQPAAPKAPQPAAPAKAGV